MRRFLLNVLPSGFHRIRHYGLISNGGRCENLARARGLLHAAPVADVEPKDAEVSAESVQPTLVCPHCGAAMLIIEVTARTTNTRTTSSERAAMNIDSLYRPSKLCWHMPSRCCFALMGKIDAFTSAHNTCVWPNDFGIDD
jgi:hypothetical protein